MLSTATLIGLILAIIGVVAWIAGSLRVANLEINLQTAKGRLTFLFAILHILAGLVIIFIDWFV